VRWAAARLLADEPYGAGRATTSGHWAGPFPTLAAARAAQRASGEPTQDECRVGRCGAHFSAPGAKPKEGGRAPGGHRARGRSGR
jgi:hypothetical protein